MSSDPSLAPLRSLPPVWTIWTRAARDIRHRWQTGMIPSTEPRPDHRRLAAAIALVLCVAIVTLAIVADAAVARAAHGLSPAWVHFFTQVTKIGESGWIFALSAIIALAAIVAAKGTRSGAGRRAAFGLEAIAARATFLFATNAVAGILSQVIKHIAGRARPKYLDLVGPFHFDLFSLNASYASFPSGHTITAFASATALALFLPRWRVPLLLLATLVGLSRLAVGAHYPSDVLAGAALGAATTYYLARACAVRGLVFRRRADGRLVPRAAGLVWPALASLRKRDAR